jgi:hypothetical protein
MLHGTRAPTMTSLWLTETYGLSGDEREAFRHQIPEIVIENTITGPLRIDRPYSLSIKHSIVDAGNGVGVDVAAGAYGILSTVDDEPGPPLHFEGITVLGRTYVERLGGAGGIWSDTVEVLDNQDGCVRQSCFHGTGNRLPTNYACVGREDVHLSFESECFGHPAYGRLSPNSGFTIRERGPGDDAMGAFGFLKNAHRLRNVAIRYREYMPADIRPVLVPVT